MALPAEETKSKFKSTVKDQSGAGKVKIGELLCKAGYITTTQFDLAKADQKKSGRLLSLILLDMGAVEEDTVLNFLSRMQNIPATSITREPPSDEAVQLFTFDILKEYFAFPLRMAGNTLQMAMAEPTDTSAVEMLQNIAKRNLELFVATARDIAEAYQQHYKISEEDYKNLLGGHQSVEDEHLVGVEDFGALVADASDGFELDRGEDDGLDIMGQFSASDAPIIKLVNGILLKAVQEGISDIHIEPFDRVMQVRYRKDGSLYKSMNLPLNIKSALISRLKILADLDITERRVPQDGRIKMRAGRKVVDFRVSSLPTLWGEGIVLRILDKSSLNVDLTKLGFETETFAALKRCLNRPQGMLLVTGPTGSGKTVTLYSALNSLNTEESKLLTAEDPIEFNFKGINQVNVNADVGMTFAAALRAFLRQDPDIIMVGEIRDLETAEIGIKAAMTGHLVFSTLHTNDSAATIGRMVDIGIPPYMLASSLTMV
ncbi:MAG: pilus assembly protein, partial [Desulfobulbaceae bacterium A2]